MMFSPLEPSHDFKQFLRNCQLLKMNLLQAVESRYSVYDDVEQRRAENFAVPGEYLTVFLLQMTETFMDEAHWSARCHSSYLMGHVCNSLLYLLLITELIIISQAASFCDSKKDGCQEQKLLRHLVFTFTQTAAESRLRWLPVSSVAADSPLARCFTLACRFNQTARRKADRRGRSAPDKQLCCCWWCCGLEPGVFLQQIALGGNGQAF